MNEQNEIRRIAEKALAEAAKARRSQQLVEIHLLGARGASDVGSYYANYANMISNRMIGLYDDCAALLAQDRVSSACILSRCMMETYAVGDFSQSEVVKAFNSNGIDKAAKVVLGYINSSRFKVEEQKRLKDKKFSLGDYHFTKQARHRMQHETAVAKHILNAMRYMFKREMELTGQSQSQFELTYEALCEWTHPSQTSLFHAFAKSTWDVETSFGIISFWDGALATCSRAMHCITALPELRSNMNDVAMQLSKASEQA